MSNPLGRGLNPHEVDVTGKRAFAFSAGSRTILSGVLSATRLVSSVMHRQVDACANDVHLVSFAGVWTDKAQIVSLIHLSWMLVPCSLDHLPLFMIFKSVS